MSEVSIDSLVGQYEIEIPGNGIDQTGIGSIQRKLCLWGFGEIPEIILLPNGEKVIWRWDWKVGGKGEYVGALPKRIGKFVWQARGVKLTPEQLSELGNIGSLFSGQHCKHWFDVVDRVSGFHWGQTDFGQPADCCYWGCHASAKDMILDNGGGAIRFFRDDSYFRQLGFARAWLAPWHDCWIVFNGYGLETLAIARILAAHLGHAYYRRIQLTNQGAKEGELWINNGAYLVGPQESVLKWESIDLEWEELKKYRCEHCDCRIAEDDHYHNPEGNDLCETCYNEYCFYCENCDKNCWVGNGCLTNGNILCQECWNESYFECGICEKDTRWDDGVQGPDEDYYCEGCYYKRYAHCDDCCKDFLIDNMVCRDDGHYCEKCAANHPEEEENPCPAVQCWVDYHKGKKENLCPAAQ